MYTVNQFTPLWAEQLGIYASINQAIIGLDNGLSPVQRQVII